MRNPSEKILEFFDGSEQAYNYGSGYSNGSGSGPGCGSGYGNGCGSGYGNGSGSGYGNGSGSGPGCGSGYGNGCGSGYGNGSGHEFGYGYGNWSCGGEIIDVNGRKIYYIDGTPTAIDRVNGNVAMGLILNGDLTFTHCYIAKQDNYFAHGKTLRYAVEALRDKMLADIPEEERIAAFAAEHEPGVKYPNPDLYEWHHRLTGSCELGRKTFMSDHGINMDGSMTLEEFIRLTRNAYGGDVIRKLGEYYHVD